MERFGSTLRRGNSVQSIFMFVFVVLITTLLWVIVGSQPAHAADANWNNDTIIYDGHNFTAAENFKDPTGTVPSDATVYQSQPQDVQYTDDQKVFVIYFSSGVDPPTATKAKYVEFNYSAANELSNPQNPRDITLTLKGQEEENTSCSVDGIGWIICPVSMFIAEGMDNVFNILSTMIAVKPTVLGDSNNSMYVAWNVMRNIANIAFVIAFLIIIYSQLTSFGVSNYGLKKLIPRLIIAAILVNVSFIISAIAIDISNILGYSIQNIFNEIRENVFNLTNDNFSGVNDNPWTTVTTVVLAGGGTIGAWAYVDSAGLYFLLPLLLGLILTLVFVVIVLAARQAIITILVIIAPIAFVANLLPNTEKWFDKWRDLFFTMLVFFPAFSLVFGGSQLAGQLIIQNAGANIVTVIFGMAVQIAPLVITPLLLKFSGSLLGRIAQIANNPSKGILDRSKNWASARGEMQKQKSLSKPTGWWNIGRNINQGMDSSSRNVKDRTELYKLRADNRYHSSQAYEAMHEEMHGVELDKQRIDAQHASHIGSKVNTRGTTLNLKHLELDNAKGLVESTTEATNAMTAEYRAGAYNTGGNERLARLQTSMAENAFRSGAQKQRAQAANYIQQEKFANAINENQILGSDTEGLLTIATGVGGGNAQIRAQSTATATIQKLRQEALDNNKTLIRFEAQKIGERGVDLSRKYIEMAKSSDIAVRNQITADQLEAAYEMQADDGQTLIFEEGRASEHIDDRLLDRVIERNAGTMKQKGAFHLQANPQLSYKRYLEKFFTGQSSDKLEDKLQYYDLESHEMKVVENEADVRKVFEADMQRARLETFAASNAENLGGIKFGTFVNTANNLDEFLKTLDLDPAVETKRSQADKKTVRGIHGAIRNALKDSSILGKMNDRADEAELIDAKLSEILGVAKFERPPEERVTPAGQPERPATGDYQPPVTDPSEGSPSETSNED
jgi:hypothetical protein